MKAKKKRLRKRLIKVMDIKEKRLRKLMIEAHERPDECLVNHPRYLTDLVLYKAFNEPHMIYGTQVSNIRMCSTCGKKYNDAPALA